MHGMSCNTKRSMNAHLRLEGKGLNLLVFRHDHLHLYLFTFPWLPLHKKISLAAAPTLARSVPEP